MWANPIVTRFIGGKPSTREELWMRLMRNVGHWSLLGFGYWVVEVKASGRFVGEVGFAELKRDIEPSFEGMPEGGWVLAPEAHGKGFATEAVKAILAWGDKHFAGRTTTCIISPENTASIRVAEKCGYREVARTTSRANRPSVRPLWVSCAHRRRNVPPHDEGILRAPRWRGFIWPTRPRLSTR